MNILFHNKGIELTNLPRILHDKNVVGTVPLFVEHREPPIVSYKYTNTIYNSIFNFKSVIKCIDFDVGTTNMICNCHSSKYTYAPVGHVVTGNLGNCKRL